ncbi:MAG: hypothetical protein GXY36_17810 [Chloroflexi bacterium]|nr:hypothetical protein [Chloroflexota bacterium]
MLVFRRSLSLLLMLSIVLTVPLPAPARAQDTSTITIGMTDLPTTLDPGEAYDFAAWEVLSHLYTGLTRQVPGTFEYELALAADYTVSDDGLTYTFTLRDDAAFSDGTPITAQTFVDSMARVERLLRDAGQAVEPYVEGVSVGDDDTLVYQLKVPVPYFLGLLALPPYFPMHPTLAATGQPQPLEPVIGNGPYLLDSFAVRDQIVLKANPDYQFGPAPATETIVLRYYARSQDLRDAVRRREVDLAWRALFLPDVQALETVEGLNVIDQPGTRVFYLYMNHDLEPTDDPLVREALTLLLSRQSVVSEVFDGKATALTSLVPDLFPEAYAAIWPDDPDVAQAEEILRDAAYSSRGQSRLSLGITTSEPTYGNLYVAAAVELVRASFNLTDFIESGVFADIDTSTFIRALERGEGRLVLFGWTPIVPHPAAYLRPLAHSAEPIPSRAEYALPEIDALLDEAALLDDPAAQGERYQAAARLLLDNQTLAPLWQDHIQLVAWDDIGGIQLEPNFFLHYDQLVRE